jgi:two-component system, sensor histidine kinase RegB
MPPRIAGVRHWLVPSVQGEEFFAARGSASHSLRMLFMLRVATPLTQALTIWLVSDHFEVSAPGGPIGVLLLVESLVAAATWLRLRDTPGVSPLELMLQAHVDIGLFAAMLYFTGGTANPFAPLFVLPVIITSGALPARGVWITATSTIVCYAWLRGYHVSLSHPKGHTEVYSLLQDGMVVNYTLTVALLAFFCTRTHEALRAHMQRASDARDAQMRSESVGAIGALAAGSAHELGSPLATMSVLVTELKNTYRSDARLQSDLQVIDDQIYACKRIVAKMASAGDEQRAESASGARVDDFIESTVERVRSMNPGASIRTTLDRATPAPRIVAEETFRQAITNLIENAVHASPQWVEVSTSWSGADLIVEVADEGPGVPDEVRQYLGKKMASTKGVGRGLGLGLLLGAETVERLGGALELADRSPRGTLARLRVPLAAIVINDNPAQSD